MQRVPTDSNDKPRQDIKIKKSGMMKPKEATPTTNPEETKEVVKEVALEVASVGEVKREDRDKMFEKNPRSKASIKKLKKDKKKHHKHEEKPSSTSDWFTYF